jgi:repressor LexA
MKKTNSSLPSLTAKEKAVLQFIEIELVSKGISPSYQEICDHFGFASYNSVQNYLKQLTAKGYVSLQQNQKRAIQLLHSAQDFQTNLIERLQVPAESSRGSAYQSCRRSAYRAISCQ